MDDPMRGHSCIRIAQVVNCGEGREIWLGRLLEPVPDYPLETHCLHVTTPAKSVVFGVNLGDMSALAVLCQIVHEGPFNQRWLNSMESVYRAKVDEAASERE